MLLTLRNSGVHILIIRFTRMFMSTYYIFIRKLTKRLSWVLSFTSAFHLRNYDNPVNYCELGAIFNIKNTTIPEKYGLFYF